MNSDNFLIFLYQNPINKTLFNPNYQYFLQSVTEKCFRASP